MLRGFKRRFAPHVEDGSKTHTIRGRRRDARKPVIGETLSCYVDPRQRTMRLLGRFECVKVEEITIEERHGRPALVFICGIALQPDECNDLAWRDGFRTSGRAGAFAEMMKFWDGRLPFDGYIIHWRFSSTPAPKNWRRKR